MQVEQTDDRKFAADHAIEDAERKPLHDRDACGVVCQRIGGGKVGDSMEGRFHGGLKHDAESRLLLFVPIDGVLNVGEELGQESELRVHV